ncbi:MAG: ribosomal protein S18-alanine N-acetyltransferase [Parasphingorhabdus sp.]|uniref:ribosomal protein S18-alanine N-acetyltransferase n=1 Tax=Parasphingorhabdus sp. TaxID=2709688 RepID=UPI0032975E18
MSSLFSPPHDDPSAVNEASIIALEYAGMEKLKLVMAIMNSAFSPLYGESWNEHQCRSMLCLPGTQLMIANIEDESCGFAISRSLAGEEELLMIAVSPQHQGHGIGIALLERLLDDAVRNGVSAVFLEVRSNNPAQNLYQRLGFEKIGTRPAYYTGDNKEKFDAITYKKQL